MKKSPLSTPCTSRFRQRDGWKSQENNKRINTGYDPVEGNRFSRWSLNDNGNNCARGNDQVVDGFIPLNVSSPLPFMNRRRYDGAQIPAAANSTVAAPGSYRYGTDRNKFGFYNNRDGYHATSKSHPYNSYSPYKNTANKFHGQKKQKGMRRQVDISKYVDMSALEDPWEELTKQLNESKKDLAPTTVSTNTSETELTKQLNESEKDVAPTTVSTNTSETLDSSGNSTLNLEDNDARCEDAKCNETSDSLCNTSVDLNDTDSNLLATASDPGKNIKHDEERKNKSFPLSSSCSARIEEASTVDPKASTQNVDRKSI